MDQTRKSARWSCWSGPTQKAGRTHRSRDLCQKETSNGKKGCAGTIVTHPPWRATTHHPQTSYCHRVIRRGEASEPDPNPLKTPGSNDAQLPRLEAAHIQ